MSTTTTKGITTMFQFTDADGFDITMEYAQVTPAAAKRMLRKNAKTNRPVTAANVQRLADDMTDGKFKFVGDTVVESASGELLDGQHRLRAIVKSGVSVRVLIVRGVSDDAMDRVDQGKARTVANILHTTSRTIANQSTVIAATSVLMLGDKDLSRFAGNRPRVADQTWEWSGEIAPWATWAKNVLKNSRGFYVSRSHPLGAVKDRRAASESALTALGVIMERDGGDADTIKQFFEAVIQGNITADDSARYFVNSLHKYLTETRPMIRSGGTQLPDLFRVFDTAIRYYNGWRLGVHRVAVPSASDATGIRYIADIEQVTDK